MTSPPEEMPPLLIPRPRSLRLLGGRVEVGADLIGAVDRLLAAGEVQPGAGPPDIELVHAARDAFPADRGSDLYRIVVDRGAPGTAPIRVEVGGADRRVPLRTLRQLLVQFGASMPRLVIEDGAAFEMRGLMLDISRNKVPTMTQLRAVVDLIASLKFNHLQLYTEHTFAYAGHEEVWLDASPVTPAEARALDAYAAARGVELAANQNCFGHLAEWLRRGRYAHLAEIEGDGAWRFMQWERRGPFSLCPVEPGSEALVRDLLGQLLPCFTSPLVNIGCDETFDVGWGRSRAEVQRRAEAEFGGDQSRARAAVYLDFVNRVCAIARAHGKRPAMWADIALHHPEMLDRLGKEVIGLAWGYEPDARFADECAALGAHGLEAWVCPGTSTWRSITGRTTEARGNMLAAAAVAGRARGLLVCEWGDVGHMQQWPLTVARLADAAEAAWSGPAAAFDPAAASLQVFGDRSLRIGPWIDDLGDLDLAMRRAAGVRNATAIFNDLFPPVPPPQGARYLASAPLASWELLRDRLGELERTRPCLAGTAPEGERVDQELEHTLVMARLAVEHGASCRRPGGGVRPPADDRPRLRDLAVACLEDLRRLWMIRNRPGGLEAASRHLQTLIAGLDA